MKKVPMTVAGAEMLREELQRLKSVDRPRIIASIAEARAHGDLKENAEYHAAREQQSFMEGRVQEIEGKLSNIQVIDVTQLENEGKVILNLKTEQEVIYKVVGEDEADIKVAKISVTSPIARALIGKFVGDTVEVHTPDGVISYEITDVEYI
jgi:transcription elongation factor GreA